MVQPAGRDEGAEAEIQAGERFGFGDNWARFLDLLDDRRVHAAEDSLRDMLGASDLAGRTFCDIGSGSGLFSLAARNLGATVHSLDYDPQSVACTAELRRRFHPGDPDWVVEEASVLDTGHLAKLGTFDVVYSWGVLHHTGAMWEALANVAPLVAPGGQLFIAIYNDQGVATKTWTALKRRYNRSGPLGRRAIVAACRSYFDGRDLATWLSHHAGTLLREHHLATDGTGARRRGMDRERDLLDWVGGWPFEVAKPEQILDLYRPEGFELERLVTCAGGLGCNEFVFRRTG